MEDDRKKPSEKAFKNNFSGETWLRKVEIFQRNLFLENGTFRSFKMTDDIQMTSLILI